MDFVTLLQNPRFSILLKYMIQLFSSFWFSFESNFLHHFAFSKLSVCVNFFSIFSYANFLALMPGSPDSCFSFVIRLLQTNICSEGCFQFCNQVTLLPCKIEPFKIKVLHQFVVFISKCFRLGHFLK